MTITFPSIPPGPLTITRMMMGPIHASTATGLEILQAHARRELGQRLAPLRNQLGEVVQDALVLWDPLRRLVCARRARRLRRRGERMVAAPRTKRGKARYAYVPTFHVVFHMNTTIPTE